MPWCSIEKTYDVAEIKIIPFRRQRPIEGLDTAAKCCVNTILSIYKTIEGKPIDSAAIVRYGEKSLIDDLGEEERGILHELVTLACFCALVKREYFNPIGPYCNSECFDIYIQKFDTVDFIALTTRRREGQTLSGWPIEDIAITIPVHCHPFRGVRLDEALLKALTAHRKQSKNEEWVRVAERYFLLQSSEHRRRKGSLSSGMGSTVQCIRTSTSSQIRSQGCCEQILGKPGPQAGVDGTKRK